MKLNKPKFLIESKDKNKNCAHCRFYATYCLASPAGWCSLYPSERVNTDDFSICYKFKPCLPFKVGKYITDSWEEIANNKDKNKYSIGDFKEIIFENKKILMEIIAIENDKVTWKDNK